jgi:hypothetical protein
MSMKTPWLLVGTFSGNVAIEVLLPMVSDSTHHGRIAVILAGLKSGFLRPNVV